MTLATRPPLVRIPRDGALPVSYTQRERLETGRGVYLPNNTVTISLRFDGPFDLDVLSRTVSAVVARHEGLRVVFPTDQRAALIEPSGCLRVAEVGPDCPDPYAAAIDLLSADAQVPFDLAAGPLFRCLAVRVDETTHLLGIAIDHVIADGWSCNLLVRDLLGTYEALRHGEEPELPPLPVQHLDFVAWELAYLSGGAEERLLDYWRTALGSTDPIPDSGLVDVSVPADAPATLERVRHPLADGFRQRLARFAAACRITPYAVLGAALSAAVLTQRRADGVPSADDVALFASFGNRTHATVQDAFGYFATPGTLRTDLSGDPDFTELVRRQARTVSGALRHQELPHAVVVRELRPDQYGCRYRGGAGPATRYLNFDLAQQRARPFGFGVRGLTASMISVPRPDTPRGGLRLLAYQLESSMDLELRYRTDRYSAPWAERFSDRMRQILYDGVADPSQPLSTLGKLADRSTS
ncbi:MAG: condensation domain-containing protein [Micromonosporaceae bacterium]